MLNVFLSVCLNEDKRKSMQNDEQNWNQQRNKEIRSGGKLSKNCTRKNSAPEKNKSQNKDKEQVSTERFSKRNEKNNRNTKGKLKEIQKETKTDCVS